MERVNPQTIEARVIDIDSLEQEGRGVGRWQGKAIFVDGALPGERVEFSPYRRKPAYEFAKPAKLLRESAQRVQPRCPHFGMCGGCNLQHFEPRAQVAAKQRIPKMRCGISDASGPSTSSRPYMALPGPTGRGPG